MKCPVWNICVTPNWYSIEKEKFIEEICSTDNHKDCIHFQSSNWPSKDTERWKRVVDYIRNHPLFKESHPG